MQGQCGSLNVEEPDEERPDEDDPVGHANSNIYIYIIFMIAYH